MEATMIDNGHWVKLTQIEHNRIDLATDYWALNGLEVIRALLQAWRNMPQQIHFEQLVVSVADAENLHENASCFEDFDRISRVAWNHPHFLSRKQYESFISTVGHERPAARSTIKLFNTPRKTRYARVEPGDEADLAALADSYILTVLKTTSSDPLNEYQVTFKNAEFFDFMRVGMTWRYHRWQGKLCPSCFCVEAQVEVETKSDFITESRDARNLDGTSITISKYRCSACEAEWEQTKYSRYTDFTY